VHAPVTMSGLSHWSPGPPVPKDIRYFCDGFYDQTDNIPLPHWWEPTIRFGKQPPWQYPRRDPERLYFVSPASVGRARRRADKAAKRRHPPDFKPAWQPPAQKLTSLINHFDMLMDDEIVDKASLAEHKRVYSVDEILIRERWHAAQYSSAKAVELDEPGAESRDERHQFDLWPFLTERVGTNQLDLKVRPLTEREVRHGFEWMTTLADQISRNKNPEIFRIIDAKVAWAKAYQAAEFVLRLDRFGVRDRGIPKHYVLAARFVYQRIHFELLLRDYEVRIEQVSRGRRKRGPSRLDVVTFMLQPGVSSTDAKLRFERNDRDLRSLRADELDLLEEKYGRFCKALVIPPETKVRAGYNDNRGKRQIETCLLSPDERVRELRDYVSKAKAATGLLRKSYLRIAKYLFTVGKILIIPPIYFGTAPLRDDDRRRREKVAGDAGYSTESDPELFEPPKRRRPKPDKEYGIDVGMRHGLADAVTALEDDLEPLTETRMPETDVDTSDVPLFE
jgi:hypothetical protein